MAFPPQSNTSFATNQMILSLFYGDANRLPGNRLLVMPLNQVHDETVMQFPIDQLDRATNIISGASHNSLTCWGTTFTIPFGAAYGSNWGTCNTELSL